ncbi:uncharacterized protein CANTADRAFT_7613 [Suhomyces tanzawaensis NRRL Y-17324]|uniref:FAD-binding FR-type domain-containing protein n=1 Tax=Suhomyces tanzawaensis NRRL Y-17324 TaxID=984487 RepID=A0A1E4SF68_9ASCO|nr:uncharacterized protein CANTADRAFT_7613 [Suhomyces tanzawaensis NRRL Y-17324]ODV78161.1 hypothetical protein CANTADRAFT_7613 [Suhomyces tanzawaensis NRRL Y-17324]
MVRLSNALAGALTLSSAFALNGVIIYHKKDLAIEACTLLIAKSATLFNKTDKAGYCSVKNQQALGTMAHCMEQLPYKKSRQSFLDYCDKKNHSITEEQYLAAYDNATSHLVKNVTADDPTYKITKLYYKPVALSQVKVKGAWESEVGRYYNYNWAHWYGIALASYWFFVMLIAGICNLTYFLFPNFVKKLTGSTINAYRKHVTLPALFGKSHAHHLQFLKVFQVLLPTRLESILVFIWVAMTIIFMSVKYKHDKPNVIWPKSIAIEIGRKIGDRTGIAVLYVIPTLILFAGRNNFMQWVSGWPYSRFVYIHKWLARAAFLMIVVHAVGMTYNGIGLGKFVFRNNKDYMRFGYVATVAAGLMMFQSLLVFRRTNYELFLAFHILLAVLFILGGWRHTTEDGFQQFYYAATAIWVFDRVVRLARLAAFGIRSAEVRLVANETLRVTMTRPSYWVPYPNCNAYIHFIRPTCFWQSHPFTIVDSVTEHNTITFYLKVKGGITHGLYQYLSKQPDNTAMIKVSIEGPYGQRSAMSRFENTVFLAGGNGIPGLYDEATQIAKKRSGGVKLVWVIRHFRSIEWFYPELLKLKNSGVETTIFVTQPHLGLTNPIVPHALDGSDDELERSEEEEEKKSENLEESNDYIQNVKNKLNFIEFREGRPDIYEYVAQEIAQTNGPIAFGTCAHAKMVDEARKSVADHLNDTKYRVELFEQLQTCLAHPVARIWILHPACWNLELSPISAQPAQAAIRFSTTSNHQMHHHRATHTYNVVRGYTPTIDVHPRADSSDSSETDRCKHSNSGECQKPVSNNAETIALAVVLPCVVIIIVLGCFLFRNYRKEKKESMEHDPDFDENGEATALPDLPNPKYNMEDPFHNRNSVRYPQAVAEAGAPGLNFHHVNKSSSSLAMSNMTGDPYIDTFSLPYQHQTGSKASLDDYARNFGINGIDGPTRASAYVNRTRNSSISQPPINGFANVSPQKSNLRTEITNANVQKSPVKKFGNKEYTNIPNHSTTSIRDGTELTKFTTASDIESVTNSEDSSAGEKYEGGVKYENESTLEVNNNSTAPRPFFDKVLGIPPTAGLSYDREAHSAHAHHPEPTVEESPVYIDSHTDDKLTSSPFDDTVNDTTANTTSNTYPEREHKLDYENEEPIDGDFNFSTDNNTTQDQSHLTQDLESTPFAKSKSPRISQFNLLKNDSDEEDFNNEDEVEGQALTAEKEEELKRMKSVYRVYFDGESTHNPGDEEERGFKVDPSQPLPQINVDGIPQAKSDERIRINNELTMDTNYDKRMTTTSSIYPEGADQSYNQSYEEQHFYEQQHVQPPVDLPPLQQLRNASDIRKSTLQTYTDFRPKTKNVVTSPTQKHTFSPVDNWTSPKNSPVNQSQSSFVSVNQPQSILPPSNSSTSLNGSVGTVPSATQLSRSSVVMLNPVTEITKQRKFKPAGSLPANSAASPPNPYNPQFNQSFASTDGSLIPGNRKSDVRRMMNTNF